MTNPLPSFEPTNDEIVPFPPGLHMVSGDAMTREAPSSGSGALQLDPALGDIQPVQWTCPAEGDPDRYPPDSDGSTAGIADPNNKGAGAGFPVINCNGQYSPLRQDIHSEPLSVLVDPSTATVQFVILVKS